MMYFLSRNPLWILSEAQKTDGESTISLVIVL